MKLKFKPIIEKLEIKVYGSTSGPRIPTGSNTIIDSTTDVSTPFIETTTTAESTPNTIRSTIDISSIPTIIDDPIPSDLTTTTLISTIESTTEVSTTYISDSTTEVSSTTIEICQTSTTPPPELRDCKCREYLSVAAHAAKIASEYDYLAAELQFKAQKVLQELSYSSKKVAYSTPELMNKANDDARDIADEALMAISKAKEAQREAEKATRAVGHLSAKAFKTCKEEYY